MTAPGERLTPQQMRLELASERRFEGTPGAARRGALFEMVERALAAWQADREALEAASQKAQLYDEFPWGEIARDAHGFPVTADDWEKVRAYARQLEALLRVGRDFALQNTRAAAVRHKFFAWGDEVDDVLAELDAAQGVSR